MIWNYENDFLTHYGVKGQKWGLRRYQNADGSLTEEGRRHYGVYDKEDGTKDMKRLQRDAKKDAEDMARAKAYYGEGAGNRRKQIRNRISERMKDPDYKEAYERNLANQNMSEHQKAANRERKVQDAKNSTMKFARGVKNLLLGFGTTSLAAVALVSYARNPVVRETINRYGRKAMSSIRNMTGKVRVTDFNWHANGSRNATMEWLNRRR